MARAMASYLLWYFWDLQSLCGFGIGGIRGIIDLVIKLLHNYFKYEQTSISLKSLNLKIGKSFSNYGKLIIPSVQC